MMSYKTACRLCLKDLQGRGIDCLAIDEMRETIQSLFGIEITQTDITSAICNKCFEKTMSFKAFKKTVHECQCIIAEYETIREKILQKQTAIKEEIIDLSESETENPTTSNKKKKRPAPTDSEINDILNIVHESNDANKGKKKGNKQSNKIPSQTLRIKTEKKFPDPVQSPDSGNDSTKTCTLESSSVTAFSESEPTSEENEQENRLAPNCCTSTSGIAETSEDAVKTEYETTSTTFNVPLALAVDAVSSSIRSPDKDQREPESEAVPSTSRTQQTLQNNSSSEYVEATPAYNISNKNDELNHEESEDETFAGSPKPTRLIVKMKKINFVNKNDSRDVETPQPSTSTPNKSNNISKSNVSSYDFICLNCSGKFQSQKDLDCHIKEHTEDTETVRANKRGSRKRHSEPDSTTIRRSARIAQSQALQNLVIPEKKPDRRKTCNTTSLRKTSSDLQSAIAQLALTQQMLARTNASSPTTSSPSTSSSPYLGYIRSRSHSRRNSKRIITITLLRSRDSVNFRYCDQYKNIIDFESVTSEELCDIRSSLMSPNIWHNLTEVFKTSTPDDETITQLKTIFGQGFRWS